MITTPEQNTPEPSTPEPSTPARTSRRRPLAIAVGITTLAPAGAIPRGVSASLRGDLQLLR